jgi:hypothetical protein
MGPEAAAAPAGHDIRPITLLSLAAQLALAVLVIQTYQIETRAFFRVAVLAAVGFVIHALLPLRWRMAFFVAMSFAALWPVLGSQDTVLLICVGIGMIMVARSPLPFAIRVGALLAIGGLLALGRSGVVPTPWAAGFWAVLGSMFMFRMALYLHALRHAERRPTWTQTLAYFFMLPNACFPLFPVVDHGTFVKNYYDADAAGIYQTGLKWITRGLVHLLLYRLVYLHLTVDPTGIEHLGQFLQHLLSTFLLYLRVSGQFHLAVGVLHLFGFRLPETHKLYYLASSFTDFWRRINIYWKDFMMKLVYYPSFFRFRRLGERTAMVSATVIVFLLTWLLHSYQWFWLRGGFPITMPDVAFWGILGTLVVVTALREARRGRQRTLTRKRAWSLSRGAATVGTFTAICVLWSLWSSESVIEWFHLWGAVANPRPFDILLLLALTVGGLAVAGRNWDPSPVPPTRRPPLWHRTSVQTALVLIVILVLGQAPVQDLAGPRVAGVVASLQKSTLNARDVALQHRGYYEKLDIAGRQGTQLWDIQSKVPADWVFFVRTPMHRTHPGAWLPSDLAPSTEVFAAGTTMRTNRWGMRDREYEKAKPPGTFRIALLGSSYVMGTGVADGEVFEQVVEDRLNNELRGDGQRTFEVLNFGVSGYSLLSQLALVEERVPEFAPDVVILTIDPLVNQWVAKDLTRTIREGISAPYPEIRALLDRAGLLDMPSRTGPPVPFATLRRGLASVGIPSRMPWRESDARIRGIVDDVVRWTLQRAADQIRANGAIPVLVNMDVVTGLPPQQPPAMAVAREAGFNVLDLSDVYLGQDPTILRVAEWDDHPNAYASRLIGNRLFTEIHQRAASLGLLSPGTAGSVRRGAP